MKKTRGILKELLSGYVWTYDLYTGELRAYGNKNNLLNCFCPITAACQSITKVEFTPDDWYESAIHANMNTEYARLIVGLSDNPKKRLENPKLWKELAIACGVDFQQGLIWADVKNALIEPS